MSPNRLRIRGYERVSAAIQGGRPLGTGSSHDNYRVLALERISVNAESDVQPAFGESSILYAHTVPACSRKKSLICATLAITANPAVA